MAVRSAQKFFSEDKDHSFESKVRYSDISFPIFSLAMRMTDESARLLTFQQQLENETDGKIKFFGLSVNQTMRACILNGFSKRADKIKSDFKVPDKRFVIFGSCGKLVE